MELKQRIQPILKEHAADVYREFSRTATRLWLCLKRQRVDVHDLDYLSGDLTALELLEILDYVAKKPKVRALFARRRPGTPAKKLADMERHVGGARSADEPGVSAV